MTDSLLRAVLETEDSAEKSAIVAEAAFAHLPVETALAAQRSFILHWFDQSIIEALLEDSELTIEEMSKVYQQLAALPFVDIIPRGLTFQDSTREGLCKRYSLTQPELFQIAARLAAPAYEVHEEDDKFLAEAFFCYMIAGDQQASSVLQNMLFEKASSYKDWQWIDYLLHLQDEAEQFPFVQPLPRTEQQLLLQGLVHRVCGQEEAALLDYDQALVLNPKSIIAYVSRGTAYAEQERFVEALNNYNIALQLDQNASEAYISRGIIYAKQAQYTKALKDFDKAIQCGLSNNVVFCNRGNMLNELRRYRDAIVAYDAALFFNPEDGEAYIGKERALNGLKQYGQAPISHWSTGEQRSVNTVLSGSLKDFGLVEVLQMMELGGMTGALRLKHLTGRIGIIYFSEGKMANCSELNVGALTLGDVLQQLGMATPQQIEQAFSQQLQNAFGQRIGERLVAMGAISDKQLREALRMKALWTARELALWQEGSYEFIASPNAQTLLPYGEASLDLEVMRVTMEMVHYSDEWEHLRQFLPQGVRTLLQIVPAIPYAMSFDTRTFELLTHVNLYHRVRRIASAMRRPELDVARELAQLVQQKLLIHVFQEVMPQSSGREVRLPDPAEKLRMENFELLNLISRMEQEWNRRRTPMEQLPALVEFINWTMDALAETYRNRGAELDPNTLRSLLYRENLRYMGNYEFKIDQNHIDVDNFKALCYEVLDANMEQTADFYDEASLVLQHILRCIFDTINSRVASLDERLENQEVLDAMFTQLALQR